MRWTLDLYFTTGGSIFQWAIELRGNWSSRQLFRLIWVLREELIWRGLSKWMLKPQQEDGRENSWSVNRSLCQIGGSLESQGWYSLGHHWDADNGLLYKRSKVPEVKRTDCSVLKRTATEVLVFLHFSQRYSFRSSSMSTAVKNLRKRSSEIRKYTTCRLLRAGTSVVLLEMQLISLPGSGLFCCEVDCYFSHC